jgi:cathepsin L
MDSAFEYVDDNGLALASDYPYTAKDGVCKSVKRPFTSLLGYFDIEDCEELRELVFVGAIAVAVDATNWS